MKIRASYLIALVFLLSFDLQAQSGLGASRGELPLLSVIVAGIVGGGIWSVTKTRHQQ